MRKFIYLTSEHHSGSTLLAFVLGAHPYIATIGELVGLPPEGDFDSYSCSCGERIYDCKFWREIRQRMEQFEPTFSLREFKTRYPVQSNNKLLTKLQYADLKDVRLNRMRDQVYNKIPSCRRAVESITRQNLQLAQTVCDVMHKDIFLDSSKTPQRIKYLYPRLDCECKVIWLIKDGRGVFDSLKRYHPHLSDTQAILHWKRMNQYIEEEIARIPRHAVHVLRYQDLAKNTAAEIKKMCEFIGIPYSPTCLRFRSQEHHIMGNNNMRLGNSEEIYFDEKWRRSLTQPQLHLFEKLAGKLNKAYGYA